VRGTKLTRNFKSSIKYIYPQLPSRSHLFLPFQRRPATLSSCGANEGSSLSEEFGAGDIDAVAAMREVRIWLIELDGMGYYCWTSWAPTPTIR
jgi:hypothetical protein